MDILLIFCFISVFATVFTWFWSKHNIGPEHVRLKEQEFLSYTGVAMSGMVLFFTGMSVAVTVALCITGQAGTLGFWVPFAIAASLFVGTRELRWSLRVLKSPTVADELLQ